MCGRYALGIRASLIRYNLQQQGLQVDDAPADDDVRETFNFPPGSYGIVYRADVPDGGMRDATDLAHGPESTPIQDLESRHVARDDTNVSDATTKYQFHLKAMKWGMIPFWTKRSPDYSSMLKTINCRDDSLLENKGMWTSMKQRKRCIVVAQGFYEWLKKGPGGKERIPHFVKRKDGNLMLFAGLWDCVKYENTDEKLYSYTIITTDSNKELSFLHDRMPVILDPNTEAMERWLDPTRNKWTAELQRILKPYEGELECYPVHKDVGKVGNNSPNFIVPVDSKQNKDNIMNFFSNASKKKDMAKTMIDDKSAREDQNSESHAPRPIPEDVQAGSKRQHEDDQISSKKVPRNDAKSAQSESPFKLSTPKKTRSATSNEGMTLKSVSTTKTPDKMQPITKFFGK